MSAPTSPPRDGRRAGLVAVVTLAGVMWVAEIVDLVLGGRLDLLGIEPREADGLTGVVLAPLLHVDFGHLLANTAPFLVLGAVVALGGLARLAAVTAIVTVVSGLGTWLFGAEGSLHVGASGVVFGFATYLVARGLFDHRLHYLAIGLLVALVYGSTLLFGLVPRPGVSWQGHLFGALGGLIAARVLAARRPLRRTAGGRPA
ncbi:rhomboid family intramembrane serine protease [Blastococcus sp. CCUG 61487]|uniref:rhomboid family intramembrane serine protease n=1 Tax=Blastococcus sp. CCUG 61487 TaxID=1840703 RepID=UPI00113BB338|nr:rhomboid family intramembrane serine protease [Blastococcus sp. CCUG 61487]TKJ18812.1 rhomboid family intramembrane serine protease [Blastococcus sp. CCUG 61487]